MPEGLHLGRYRLLERLALGGMAELYLARAEGEAGFARVCVVKRILPHLAEDPKFVQMFLDEARLAARLHHPGIVQIFELGRFENDYFFAMEYLPGEDWAALLRQSNELNRPIPLDVAARMARAAADALHYAHEARDEEENLLQPIHRDVSPSNILVTYQGVVKVLDFGIARAADNSSVTEEGRVKGKTSYMAPEQARGKRLDRRADIWALGVCLHELLTGRRLFRGDSTVEIALKVWDSPIAPPSTLRRDVPPFLDAAVMKALAREPAARFLTAAAFRDALDASVATELRGSGQVDLGLYVERLFGRERMESRLRLLSSVTPASAGPRTTPHPAMSQLWTTPVPTIPTVTPQPRHAAVWLGLAAGLAVVLGGLAWRSLHAPLPQPALVRVAQAATIPTAALIAVAPVAHPASNAPVAPTVEGAPRVPPPRKRARQVRETRSAPGEGRLTLVTQPYADVLWNSRKLGTTPLFELTLPAGKHTLRLRGADGKARKLPVEVPTGALTTLRVRLDQLPVD